MKKYWRLIQALLVTVMLGGCANGCNNANANPLGSNPVVNPTPVATATPVTGTATAQYKFVIEQQVTGTASTVPNIQIWTISQPGNINTPIYNGSVTLDSMNNYKWTAPLSAAYAQGTSTFYFSIADVGGRAVYNRVYFVNKSNSAPDSQEYIGGPPANMPDGANLSW